MTVLYFVCLSVCLYLSVRMEEGDSQVKKKKVNIAQEQAMKAQRGSKGIVLLFL